MCSNICNELPDKFKNVSGSLIQSSHPLTLLEIAIIEPVPLEVN